MLIEGQRITFDVEPDKKGKGPKAVDLVISPAETAFPGVKTQELNRASPTLVALCRQMKMPAPNGSGVLIESRSWWGNVIMLTEPSEAVIHSEAQQAGFEAVVGPVTV